MSQLRTWECCCTPGRSREPLSWVAAPVPRVFQQRQWLPDPESCGHGQYWSAGWCCNFCPAGEYVEKHCVSPSTQGKCKECDQGTFTAFPNGLDSCFLCSTCLENEEMVADCSPTSDRVCQCRTGHFYQDLESSELCIPCSKCTQGSIVLQECNSTADTICSVTDPSSREWLYWLFLLPLVAAPFLIVYYCCIRERQVWRVGVPLMDEVQVRGPEDGALG
ncbi:PREDICTED: tumor necrosis factor receptor superfamily member 23-like [Galeopterus variegatus]|uniref:Tumor necrosis factor receptor superfamily member 23-like n=1 Tax=Galeopterus variegatus TaxID=482537 RepID=A0ABM0RP70_GALVR|nr:PREDICTED: tumor necrosis factor receptor superfamily member 23-like [Galeopterus variegatus]